MDDTFTGDQVRRDVLAAAKEIGDSVLFDGDKIRASFALPQGIQIDNETLALALQLLLEKECNLHFPASQMMFVRAGRDTGFVETGDGELPARRIAIHLSPERRLMEVEGCPPENGRDGWSELFFDWKKQAGILDERGNIDLKRLNVFPSARAGEVLAVIHRRTEGIPGVTALGKRIKQRQGQALKVKVDDKTIDRQEDGNAEKLVARRGGIVDFRLAGRDDPALLTRLEILDTITINGNVDYHVGDQGSETDRSLACSSNIVVRGDVLGVFTLQSDGFIHVSGAIEGKKISAEEVVADIIARGCSVFAASSCVAGSIISARIRARHVILRKNANESELTGLEQISLLDGANCLGLTLHTNKLVSLKNRFAGLTTVHLGGEIFPREEELLRQRDTARQGMEKCLPAVKEAVATVAEQLTSTEQLIGKALPSRPQAVQALLTAIRQQFAAAVRHFHLPVPATLVAACRKLQTTLGDANAHESIIRKVEVVIRTLQQLEGAQAQFKVFHDSIAGAEAGLAELRDAAASLSVEMNNPRFLGPSARLVVLCGGERLELHPDNLPFGKFEICYELKGEEGGLAGGKLVVRQNFGEEF
ncbi:MAG: flagellar assembly protein A [Thermodesulfobacteriota bacterium]